MEGEIVTLQHRFSTHTYFEFDYIITAHMSLQKGMGSRGQSYTHTQSNSQRRILCVLSRYDVPVQRKLLKQWFSGQGACRRYQLCLPLPVWVLEVPQLPLVDNETQPLCSTRPGTRFTDEWAGI